MALVCRSYWKCIVDLARTLYVSAFVRDRRLSPGHPEGRQVELGHRYGIVLPATDATRRPDLNAVLCGNRLFQPYVVDACVKMEQQQLNYLQFNQDSLHSTRFWQMTDIVPIVV